MPSETYDLIIVGGGIGGSALAATLARAGKSVLLLEQSEVYEDRVRGEWIAPWGVSETRRLGLYELLRAAGGHHLTRHITYDETISPQDAETAVLQLGAFAPDVPGPLCIRHPVHCQTLFDAAGRAGATALRSVQVTAVVAGSAPWVSFTHHGRARMAQAPVIIGADGRMSGVREAAGIELRQDKPHHWFAGLLVDGAAQWSEDLEAIGTEGDFSFLAFPQGGGRVRVYGGYALEQRSRFSGEGGSRRFLDAFAMKSSPNNAALVAGAPAGPLFSYFNNDSWTHRPCGAGVALIGDAAGWNDPIIGLGLSITYRDVRIVADILNSTPDWTRVDFTPYADERRERMRRLRFVASLQATLDMEFGEAARRRRQDYHERASADLSLRLHAVAVMAGPDVVPAEAFTDAHRARVLGT